MALISLPIIAIVVFITVNPQGIESNFSLIVLVCFISTPVPSQGMSFMLGEGGKWEAGECC